MGRRARVSRVLRTSEYSWEEHRYARLAGIDLIYDLIYYDACHSRHY